MSESNVVQLPVGQAEENFPLEPFEDICVLEQLEEETSKGGIVLVGKGKEFQSGRVVAAGPGRIYSNFMDASGHMQVGHFAPNPVKVGDYVIFGKYLSGGESIVIAGKKYLMARAGDLGGRSRDGNPLKIKLANPVE